MKEVIVDIEQEIPVLEEPLHFYTSVVYQDDGYGPNWAQITVTENTLRLIKTLQEMVVSNDLMQVIKHAPGDLSLFVNDKKEASSASLHVTDTHFWYTAVCEFVTGEVSTVPLRISDFLPVVLGNIDDSPLYWRRKDSVLVGPAIRRMGFLRQLRQHGEMLEWFPY